MSSTNPTRRTVIGFLRNLLAPYLAARADVVHARQSEVAPGRTERAGSIAFLQGGAGARMRSMEAKARDIVSVLDFGAKGDGVTDDTAAFDAAIATGKSVVVPYTVAGYAVADIRVVDNMQVVGEKAGMALAPTLIVATSNAAAFRHDAAENVFHCVFENLACRAAPGVTGAAFYAQRTRSHYTAYFTFRQIETYADLRTSYAGLFIFALWDRCRDGYLGHGTDRAHVAIRALADGYGQTNRQNINRIRDSMFFKAFGDDAAIVGSYGTMWMIENSDFEALHTRALAVYNVVQVRFSSCWFEGINAPSIVHAGVFAGTIAASTVTFEQCQFFLTGNAPRVVTVDAPGTISLRGNVFNLAKAGVRLCDDGKRITINEDNISPSSPDIFAGTHHDSYGDGRRYLNGASDNHVAAMTLQNEGGLAATRGFMSRADIHVASAFVTIATSHTGLGGTCIVSGYDPNGGAQFRVIKDWLGATIRDAVTPLNATGKALTFRVLGQDLQMRTGGGALIAFTTMLH